MMVGADRSTDVCAAAPTDKCCCKKYELKELSVVFDNLSTRPCKWQDLSEFIDLLY